MADQIKKQQNAIVVEEQQAVSLLDQITERVWRPKSEEQRERAKDIVGQFVKEVMKTQQTVSADAEAVINSFIGEIDKKLSAQLNAIMHHKEFQKLEASWRGLHYLVHKSETGEMLKIRVLNATKKELLKDMEKAVEFDQSTMFKKVYEDEYGIFGGFPYGTLIGDYEFGDEPQDVVLLEKVSGVAAAAHAPFVSAVHPELFNLKSFADLGNPRDLAKIFDNRKDAKYVKWRSFRESEDSKYVGLTLPHILMREPYGRDTVPVESFNFEEDVDGTDHNKYLWGNAAYAFGTRLTESFAKHRWMASIRGVENGGLVEGLPTHSFRTDEGEVALKCPTEIAITERRDKELSDLGFIPLVHCIGTDYAAFFGAQSCNKAKKYDTPEANASARLSTQLPYMFAVSRFAHYLKSIMRDKIGTFMTRQECEDFLNRWISNYVLLDDSASPEAKAKKPLREARIDVAEIPGKPGVYKAVAFLKPHFQLDKLTIALRLVAELPPPIGK